MNKRLAIKGHPTRGKEVIELLEMLGGINRYNLRGSEDEWFVLNGTLIQRSDRIFAEKGFTLEEFLEKFPYKVGDKVSSKYLKNYKIEKMEWEDTNNRVIYKLQGMGWYCADELQPYKEETMEDEDVHNKWTGLKVELELSKTVIGVSNVESLRGERFMSGFVKAIIPPKGYQVVDEKGNVINATKIVFEKKKNKYPKTYEECCKVIGYSGNYDITVTTDVDNKLFNALYKLKICRDVYWKIAGEQMGLGKPWKPKLDNYEKIFYIHNVNGKIYVCEGVEIENQILAFPTEEMRDIFHENFKELIEQCKELL